MKEPTNKDAETLLSRFPNLKDYLFQVSQVSDSDSEYAEFYRKCEVIVLEESVPTDFQVVQGDEKGCKKCFFYTRAELCTKYDIKKLVGRTCEGAKYVFKYTPKK